MSLCINPKCPHTSNPDDMLFCQACGSELLLQGRYRVIQQLGGGGFGLTFEVDEIKTHRQKVLKVLINHQPKAVELFQQEAEVLSHLNHPGIPQVERDGYFVYFPKDSQETIHCLVMEKIVGMDLQKWMSLRGMRPIDQTLALQWLRELVTILEQVHQENFFHRDIKPPNIMLRSSGELALIDFGTAREVTETYWSAQAQGQVTGIISLGYTPPEQINNQAVTQSDFFALGRTFVYLLTGREPTHPDIYDSFNDELRWRNYGTRILPEFADLIDQMIARSPSQRPANSQVILQRLAEIEQVLNPAKENQPINQISYNPITSSPSPEVVYYPLSHTIKGQDIPYFVFSIFIFILLWDLVTKRPGFPLPSPSQLIYKDWVLIFYPFYDKGGIDKGLGWQILASLQRVIISFISAAIIGVPIGYAIGQKSFLCRTFVPFFQLLDSIPILVWIPIALSLFNQNQPAAILTCFIATILPIIINTSLGVRQKYQKSHNFRDILPYIFSGLRIGIRSSWLANVASEIVMSGIIGIGFFIWDAYQNNIINHVILGAIYAGITGFILELVIGLIGEKFQIKN